MHKRTAHHGFTLVELVMVIVIMGVIGGMVSVFMKSPIDAYIASSRRAALTDTADTTVRRMARDIRKSLPNSISTTADNQCLEFIPTKVGGRYRTGDLTAGDGTGLNFVAADTTFNMLGDNAAFAADQKIAAADVIVVYNLGITGADAYSANNTALVSSVSSAAGTPLETPITIASTLFPLASSSNRFHVVPSTEKTVAYVCSGSTLYRVSKTTLAHICPVTPAATDAVLAQNLSSCKLDYSGSDLLRNAVVSLQIQMTNSGETVSLQHEVHVSNTP